jgi:hypothetical protein
MDAALEHYPYLLTSTDNWKANPTFLFTVLLKTSISDFQYCPEATSFDRNTVLYLSVWQVPVFRYGLLMRNRGYIKFETLEKQRWSYLRNIKTARNYFYKHFAKVAEHWDLPNTLGFSILKMSPLLCVVVSWSYERRVSDFLYQLPWKFQGEASTEPAYPGGHVMLGILYY